MSDVFISYSRDDKDHARALADVLSAQGWSVWWDQEILGGARFELMLPVEHLA